MKPRAERATRLELEDALSVFRRVLFPRRPHDDPRAHRERMKMLLSAGLLLGSLLFPLGVLLQTFSHGVAPQAVAVVGSALVIVSLAGMTMGFARAPRSG